MSQHSSLRKRENQHKAKNKNSKYDDSNISQAMQKVHEYIENRFKIASQYPNYEIIYEKSILIENMINMIKKKNTRKEFDFNCIDRKITPDGGVLYLYNKETLEKFPLVIAEIKHQGTNDEREAEGKERQSTGNAIERLGKNLTGIKAMLNYEDITPFVCFGWGCDFDCENPNCKTVISKVIMLNEFYPINKIYVFKRDGNANLNSYSPVSMFFRKEKWNINEMAEIMQEIAETSFRYWLF